jgi:hypothetical protein
VDAKLAPVNVGPYNLVVVVDDEQLLNDHFCKTPKMNMASG